MYAKSRLAENRQMHARHRDSGGGRSPAVRRQPDCAIIFSWHIADELAPKLRAKGFQGQLITPLPVAEVSLKAQSLRRRWMDATMGPKINARRTIKVSPWMEIIEREVEFTHGTKPELYHAVAQQDYVAIVARTPDGHIPIVRQYRPALERFTWELPAGLVDKDETRPTPAAANYWKKPVSLPKKCMNSAVMRPAPRGCRTGAFVLHRDGTAGRPANDRGRHRAQAGGLRWNWPH